MSGSKEVARTVWLYSQKYLVKEPDKFSYTARNFQQLINNLVPRQMQPVQQLNQLASEIFNQKDVKVLNKRV